MRYSNLHTHTVFSDGKHSPEDNVLSAIEKNMVSLGFSDHSYAELQTAYCIPKDSVAAYIDEIRRLQKQYAEQIEIYLGVEYDGFSQLENRELYDYILGDCHCLNVGGKQLIVDNSREEQLSNIRDYYGNDKMAYAKAYFDTYVQSVQRIQPNILGHIDLLTKFNVFDEADPAYRNLAFDALHASLKVTPLIEMNTGAMSRRFKETPYPAPFLLKEILAQGGKIVLNSDSHNKDHLTFYFDESIEILKSVGFKHIVQLQGGKFVEVGI